MVFFDKASSAKPKLSATEAMLFVADFDRARDFYVSKLGFRLAFADGTPPFFGLVQRDQGRLCLRLVRERIFLGDIREREQLLAAAVTVDTAAEIDGLFREYQTAGVDFFQPMKVDGWGSRNFIVRDPDGNLVMFAGPAT